MKKPVFIFGILSGLVSSLLLVLMCLIIEKVGFNCSMLIGYATMIMSLSFIFFGVRTYRNTYNQGFISFGKAFGAGMLICLISSLFYVLTWEIIYFNFMPDFADQYANFQIEQMKTDGATAAQLEAAMKDMEEFKINYKNPLYNSALTFLEPLPVGLVTSLISALILKKKVKPQMA